jgi:hypothetical protein
LLNKPPRANVFWPSIVDELSAREAAKQGWVAALFMSGFTLLMVITKYTTMASLVDVGIMCLIGYGCLRMSRVAAICGFSYTLFNAGYKYIMHSSVGIMPIFAIFFINAIRGTFLFHKMKIKES